MKIVNGCAFPDDDAFMVAEMKADGSYQRSHLDAAMAHVSDWTVAIDGGAHVGLWARPMTGLFAQVIAVEPSPDTFEALTYNVRGPAEKVVLKNVALGAGRGAVSMQLDTKNTARANTGARYVLPGGTIPVETIDSWNLSRLGFLKLDVEGSEYAALLGARATIARCRPIILFEDKNLWGRYGVERNGPQKLLATLKYREYQRVGCDVIWGPA